MDGLSPRSSAYAMFGAAAALLGVEVLLFARRSHAWLTLKKARSQLETEKLELERALAAARATTEQWARHAEHGNRLSMLGTTLAQVAHEINNPLTFIMLNLPRVIQLVPDSGNVMSTAARGEIAEMVADMEEGTTRIQSLTQELKAFSSRDPGSTTTVDLCDVVASSLRMLGGVLPARVQVVQEYMPAPLVLASRVRLIQVVTNLVRNAIDAAPRDASSTVRVSTGTTADGRAFVRVEDDGPGIDDALKAQVFEPFFTTRAERGGTGLGLSICREIVGELRGSIDLRSRPGSTVFEVILPPETLRRTLTPSGLSTQVKYI
jgi:two-component system C4-dicarboxylate transport sensor histidine kinase DctB